MKIRIGFVSNSSSSSFVCIATSVNPMGIDASDTEGLFGIGKILNEGIDRLWLDSKMVALLQQFPEEFQDRIAVYRKVPGIQSTESEDGGVFPIDLLALADFAETARYSKEEVVLVGETVDQNSTCDADKMIDVYIEDNNWDLDSETEKKRQPSHLIANKMRRFLRTIEKVRDL